MMRTRSLRSRLTGPAVRSALSLLALLLVQAHAATPAAAAIGFDATTTAGAVTGDVTSLSWTHTVGAAGRTGT